MTAFGPDISKWQTGIAPAHLGYKFLIARASIGRAVDSLFGDAAAFATSSRTPFAGYHFPYPTSSHPAAEQAAAWNEACAGDRQIRCMIDWESDGSHAATFNDAIDVAAAIESLGYAVTLFYTGTWYWQAQGRPDLRGLDRRGIGLIIANYGPNRLGDHDAVYAGRGGDASSVWSTPVGGVLPTIWQFGSQVRIGQTTTGQPVYGDCNAYRGDDLAKYFTTWHTDPTEDDEMNLYAASHAGGVWIGDGITRRPIATPEEWNLVVLRSTLGSGPTVRLACGAGDIITSPEQVYACEMTADQLATLGTPATP